MPTKSTAVGLPVPRKDAAAKAAGQARYTADLAAPGTLQAALLRSPHHHARIRSLDCAAARAMPGVVAVITAADVPAAKTIGPFVKDQPVLAWEVVRHQGEPVAMVVAETKAAARAALAGIRVDYEPLPFVVDPRAALEPGAPQLYPEGNRIAAFELTSGDAEGAFASADLVIEDDFQVQRISPGAMEPENSLARWEVDGSLTVVTSSQKPFVDRKEIAAVLGLPLDQVNIHSAVIGGAFGGKEDSLLAVLAALAAYVTRRPVLLANERWESFVGHPKRHPARLRYRLAARSDGTITGLDARVHLDTGAYASYGPAVGSQLTELATGPYAIPNVHIATEVAYTNSPPSGAMRGFGSPQVHFALESLMDRLAGQLGLDPLELRRRNLLRRGDQLPSLVTAGPWSDALPELLERAAQERDRLAALPTAPGRRAGVGVALAMQCMGLGAHVPDTSTHRAAWLPDGRVALYLGAPDLGQGLEVVSEQMLAEALELPPSQVAAAPLDSRTTLDGGVTCASRMTYLVGNAMLLAAEDLKAQLLRGAAGLLGVPIESLAYQGGEVIAPGRPAIPAREITSRLAEDSRAVETTATSTFPYPPETTPMHLPVGMPHVLYVFGAHVARVEVDPELGTVQVTDFTALHDIGKAINPQTAEGQVEGGVIMGIGYALYEDVAFKSNAQWVQSFTEYLIPTAEDIPARLKVVLLENPEASGPFGAKGIGEISLVPTAPALNNAVTAATGARLSALPLTPERILAALGTLSGATGP